MSWKRVKSEFLGTVKLHCLTSHKIFCPKFIGYGKSPGDQKCWCLQLLDNGSGKFRFLFGFGCKGALCPQKFVQGNFHKKVFFFSDYVGYNSIIMIYLDQKYIIVLPIQQVLQKKVWLIVLFVLQKGANVQKYNELKNYSLQYFQRW